MLFGTYSAKNLKATAFGKCLLLFNVSAIGHPGVGIHGQPIKLLLWSCFAAQHHRDISIDAEAGNMIITV